MYLGRTTAWSNIPPNRRHEEKAKAFSVFPLHGHGYTFSAEKQMMGHSFTLRAQKGPCHADRLSTTAPVSLLAVNQRRFGFALASSSGTVTGTSRRCSQAGGEGPRCTGCVTRGGRNRRASPAPFRPAGQEQSLAVASVGSEENLGKLLM